jgi:hypothetical protein
MFLPDLKLILHHYPEVNKTASTNAQGFDPTTGKMHFRFQLLQHRGRIPSGKKAISSIGVIRSKKNHENHENPAILKLTKLHQARNLW